MRMAMFLAFSRKVQVCKHCTMCCDVVVMCSSGRESSHAPPRRTIRLDVNTGKYIGRPDRGGCAMVRYTTVACTAHFSHLVTIPMCAKQAHK